LFSDEYQELCDRRDAEAYRALGAITAAICFCREKKPELAEAVLSRALERYEVADAQLQQLRMRDQKSN